MKHNEIMIGGRAVPVPKGYIQAEAEYTKAEHDAFITLSGGTTKEVARDAVLAKRVEFYERYLAGKVNIEPRTPADESSFWRKLARFSLGHKW